MNFSRAFINVNNKTEGYVKKPYDLKLIRIFCGSVGSELVSSLLHKGTIFAPSW
jgi:hypothetical protein